MGLCFRAAPELLGAGCGAGWRLHGWRSPLHIWGSAPCWSPKTPPPPVLGELRCLWEHFYGGCGGPELAGSHRALSPGATSVSLHGRGTSFVLPAFGSQQPQTSRSAHRAGRGMRLSACVVVSHWGRGWGSPPAIAELPDAGQHSSGDTLPRGLCSEMSHGEGMRAHRRREPQGRGVLVAATLSAKGLSRVTTWRPTAAYKSQQAARRRAGSSVGERAEVRAAAGMAKQYDMVECPFCDEVSKYEKLAKIGQGTFG